LITTIFLFSALAQLFFWGYFLGVAFREDDTHASEPNDEIGTAPVSVIICFHNEATNLGHCLNRVLGQKYPSEFEVLAVDDNSTDDSAAIVQELVAKHDNLRLLKPGPTRPGKKDALTFGIQNARHDFLLLTDADCSPATQAWMLLMVEPLRKGAEVVLGVGAYLGAGPKALLLNAFQRFESYYVAMKYLGFARRGLPYMGVGRNLAYRKSFFLSSGGLEAHADLPGGDDDLLIGHHALPAKTVCVSHRAAYTFSRPSYTWRAFFRQRARHQSTGFRYRPVIGLLLGLLALSHGLFYLLGFLLLFTPLWWLALVVYALRFPLIFRAHIPHFYQGGGRDFPLIRQGLRAVMVVWGDALVAPFYLFLAVASLLPAKRW